jgi:hypothetical protein
MTTTNSGHSCARRPGRLASLKLYLTALLAGAYLVIWSALASRLPESNAEPADAQPSPTAEPPISDTQGSGTAVWYTDLPPSARPSVQLPPGWRIANNPPDSPAAEDAPPVPVRVVPKRARVRTRSS